jgi:hypothetical protein
MAIITPSDISGNGTILYSTVRPSDEVKAWPSQTLTGFQPTFSTPSLNTSLIGATYMPPPSPTGTSTAPSLHSCIALSTPTRVLDDGLTLVIKACVRSSFLLEASFSTSCQTSGVIHPAFTLLQKPELARHVRHVRETGRVISPSRPG